MSAKHGRQLLAPAVEVALAPKGSTTQRLCGGALTDCPWCAVPLLLLRRRRSHAPSACSGAGFPAKRGLFAAEAVACLRDFYAAGNPNGKADM